MVYGNIAISGVAKQVHNIVNHAILQIKNARCIAGQALEHSVAPSFRAVS